MKTFFLFLFFVVGVQLHSSADTIDFYHVYYNQTVIKTYNLHDINSDKTLIAFQRATLKQDDVLRIRYWNDVMTGHTGTVKLYASEDNQLISEYKSTERFFNIPVSLLLEEESSFRVSRSIYLEREDQTMEYTLFYIKID